MQSTARFPKYMWLAILAFAIQFLIIRELHNLVTVKLLLGATYVLLTICVARNWRLLSFWAIGLGMALNILVIYANGGLMPLDPKAVYTMGFAESLDELTLGDRFGAKNVLLAPEDTRFYALSDRIPTSFPKPMLYSVGDVVVGIGLILSIGNLVRTGLSESPSPMKPRPRYPS